MSWYYASGGQQMGPVDDAALDDLVRQGVVRDDTLVWRQGMSGWQAHSVARPRQAAPVPPPAAPAPAPQWQAPSGSAAPAPAASASAAAAAPVQEMRFCSNCGRPTPVNQLTTVSGASVCASCLPSVAGVGAGAAAAAAPAAQAGYQQGGYQPPPPAYAAPGTYLPQGGYPPAAGYRQYGGFWIRFVAKVIDVIILGIVGAIIRLPLALLVGGAGVGLAGIGSSQDPSAALAMLPAIFAIAGLSFVINIVVGIIYDVYFLTTRGATPGKMVLGLRVIRADGGPITMGLAVGRYFASILSGMILCIGYIMAGFDPEKRALHDRLCDTRVIKG